HACSLARALRILTVLVPAMPGALSAVGILLADAVRDYSRTVMLPGEHIEQLESLFVDLELHAAEEFSAEGLRAIPQHSLDLRYRRQGYELNVPCDPRHPQHSIEAFHQLHNRRYGFSDPHRPIEIVNLRLRMTGAAEPYSPPFREPVPVQAAPACYAERDIFFDGEFTRSCLYHRDKLVPGDTIHGLAMITEYTSATILPPACSARIDGYGNLILTIPEESA
ncbi:MAG TPA: hypothetical protein VK670_02210, partial [Silvibacterium sp.]|nr:hypothetical protein [Silvibacterium sp.]